MLQQKIKQAVDYAQDAILRECLKLQFGRYAKEEVKNGAWLRGITQSKLDEIVVAYEATHNKAPNYEERFQRVFTPVMDHYRATRAKYYGLS
jgi:hypothetical protein